MHYYNFNIGDYVKSTMHLSLVEDLAYRRLLDRYYDTEKPLDSDVKKLCRFIRMSEHEKETQAILDEFFTLTKNGWIQKRVKKELDAYSRKADAARANGKKGGRPKKTQLVNLANPVETQSKAKQEPINNKQETINKDNSDKPKFAFKRAIIDLGVTQDVADHWMTVRKNKKAANTQRALTLLANQAAKVGLSLAQAITFAADKGWASFEADWYSNANQQKAPKAAASSNVDDFLNYGEEDYFNQQGDFIDGECS